MAQVDADKRKFFAQEAQLERVSPHEGMAHLLRLEPRLQQFVSGHDPAPAADLMLQSEAVANVLGPESGQTDPLLRSYVSRNVVCAYLRERQKASAP